MGKEKKLPKRNPLFMGIFIFLTMYWFLINGSSLRFIFYNQITSYTFSMQIFPILTLIVLLVYNWEYPLHWQTLTSVKRGFISLVFTIVYLWSIVNPLFVDKARILFLIGIVFCLSYLYFNGVNAFTVWLKKQF